MRMNVSHELDVMEMKLLRSMYGVIRMDRWRNVRVRLRNSVKGKVSDRVYRKVFN